MTREITHETREAVRVFLESVSEERCEDEFSEQAHASDIQIYMSWSGETTYGEDFRTFELVPRDPTGDPQDTVIEYTTQGVREITLSLRCESNFHDTKAEQVLSRVRGRLRQRPRRAALRAIGFGLIQTDPVRNVGGYKLDDRYRSVAVLELRLRWIWSEVEPERVEWIQTVEVETTMTTGGPASPLIDTVIVEDVEDE